ncbi:membrane dipeptidase-domain-containing protein [Pseudoneurospora amorphoporcata]|uniref:Dipeptidase n=1 Tax=Pseudoneurospora amorphoporcata TaxID=241081 RepID=A0AAN6NRJ1_9PEZI|nr:membrane dipeptidase-domain-containing protein [Pseudoneurospora amorphoporcata]
MKEEKPRDVGDVERLGAPNTRQRRGVGRKFWGAVFISLLLLHVFLRPVGYSMSGCVSGSSGEKSIERRVKRILKHTPLIDGHNDLPIMLRWKFNNHINGKNFTTGWEDGTLPGHVDLARLKDGMNGGAFWSLYWPCPANGTDFSDENYLPAVQATLQQIDLVDRLRAAYPKDFGPAVSSKAAIKAWKHHSQLISPMGIEGLHQIGNSAATLRRYHALGVRYATLVHNCGNKYADAALQENPFRKAPSHWGGVSPAGEALVNEMNRMGMIVDLAHTSVDTMKDVLGGSGKEWNGSRAPVIFSHSSAYALCPHPRNVPDDILQLVKERNSLVMVNFSPDFISCVAAPDRDDGLPDFDPENATLEHVAEHIIHIGELIGYDHVGLGSDFDGIPVAPKGLEDVSRYPDLVAELLRRGVSDADASKVVGGNILRVWRDVELVAAEMQKAGEPALEDDLRDLMPEE